MFMNDVSKVMKEYFVTVTPEQLEKDLLEAGIENCPEKNIDCPDMNCMYYYETRTGCILGYCIKDETT